VRGRSGEAWGYTCSLFVLTEVKELFEDLVTEGKQFGLETNESTTNY
jgi:hypothetical protein